jgi:hypothetical protein
MGKDNKLVGDRFRSEKESYLLRFIDGLIQDGVIVPENLEIDGKKLYKLSQSVQDKVEDVGPSNSSTNLAKEFFLFREIVQQLFSFYPRIHDFSTLNVEFSQVLVKLFEANLFGRIKLSTSEGLLEISSILDGITSFDDVNPEMLSKLEGKSLNFSPYINNVLEEFTYQSVCDAFSKDQVEKNSILEGSSIRTEVDVLAYLDDKSYLLFDVKFRRRSSQGLKESLYQLYELLQQGHITKGKPALTIALVIYTIEDKLRFTETRNKFAKMAAELFPDSHSKFRLFIVSVSNLEVLKYHLSDWKESAKTPSFQSIMFMDKPNVIHDANKVFINPDFLFHDKGSVSVWVEIESIKHYLGTRINNRYILGHATNKFKPENSEYQNVFAVSLSPDVYDRPCSKVSLRLWTSNENWVRTDSQLELNNKENKWYHLFVRWNTEKLEFFVDGSRVSVNTSYKGVWPKTTEDRMIVGSWGNDYQGHVLGLPLFRIQTSTSFLSDSWLQEELRYMSQKTNLIYRHPYSDLL